MAGHNISHYSGVQPAARSAYARAGTGRPPQINMVWATDHRTVTLSFYDGGMVCSALHACKTECSHVNLGIAGGGRYRYSVTVALVVRLQYYRKVSTLVFLSFRWHGIWPCVEDSVTITVQPSVFQRRWSIFWDCDATESLPKLRYDRIFNIAPGQIFYIFWFIPFLGWH